MCAKPYLHRFDVLRADGTNYLVACTLATHKSTRDDWSTPGGVYVARLPEHYEGPLDLRLLYDGLFRNHGYFHLSEGSGLVACETGIYRIEAPTGKRDWGFERLMPQPSSDVAALDIDGDGELEYAVIEPFHGCYFRIYKKIDGHYRMIFEHPEVTDFYHVVQAGTLCGRKVFVGGCRRGKQQLFFLYWDETKKCFACNTVAEGTGPSNAVIYNSNNGDYILSADREVGQAAVYKVEA